MRALANCFKAREAAVARRKAEAGTEAADNRALATTFFLLLIIALIYYKLAVVF
jgi:hypothetical protein